MTLKVQSVKEKTGKLDFAKIKSICTSKKTIKVKRQHTNGKYNSQNSILTRPVFRMYNEILQLNNGR
jgi:hypothetical protein